MIFVILLAVALIMSGIAVVTVVVVSSRAGSAIEPAKRSQTRLGKKSNSVGGVGSDRAGGETGQVTHTGTTKINRICAAPAPAIMGDKGSGRADSVPSVASSFLEPHVRSVDQHLSAHGDQPTDSSPNATAHPSVLATIPSIPVTDDDGDLPNPEPSDVPVQVPAVRQIGFGSEDCAQDDPSADTVRDGRRRRSGEPPGFNRPEVEYNGVVLRVSASVSADLRQALQYVIEHWWDPQEPLSPPFASGTPAAAGETNISGINRVHVVGPFRLFLLLWWATVETQFHKQKYAVSFDDVLATLTSSPSGFVQALPTFQNELEKRTTEYLLGAGTTHFSTEQASSVLQALQNRTPLAERSSILEQMVEAIRELVSRQKAAEAYPEAGSDLGEQIQTGNAIIKDLASLLANDRVNQVWDKQFGIIRQLPEDDDEGRTQFHDNLLQQYSELRKKSNGDVELSAARTKTDGWHLTARIFDPRGDHAVGAVHRYGCELYAKIANPCSTHGKVCEHQGDCGHLCVFCAVEDYDVVKANSEGRPDEDNGGKESGRATNCITCLNFVEEFESAQSSAPVNYLTSSSNQHCAEDSDQQITAYRRAGPLGFNFSFDEVPGGGSVFQVSGSMPPVPAVQRPGAAIDLQQALLQAYEDWWERTQGPPRPGEAVALLSASSPRSRDEVRRTPTPGPAIDPVSLRKLLLWWATVETQFHKYVKTKTQEYAVSLAEVLATLTSPPTVGTARRSILQQTMVEISQASSSKNAALSVEESSTLIRAIQENKDKYERDVEEIWNQQKMDDLFDNIRALPEDRANFYKRLFEKYKELRKKWSVDAPRLSVTRMGINGNGWRLTAQFIGAGGKVVGAVHRYPSHACPIMRDTGTEGPTHQKQEDDEDHLCVFCAVVEEYDHNDNEAISGTGGKPGGDNDGGKVSGETEQEYIIPPTFVEELMVALLAVIEPVVVPPVPVKDSDINSPWGGSNSSTVASNSDRFEQ